MTVREKAHNAFTTMLGAAGSCPASDAPKVRMDMYIMAECPLCSQVFPQIRSMIKCEVTCGSGRYAPDFHLNMVGVLQQTGARTTAFSTAAVPAAVQLAGELWWRRAFLQNAGRRHYEGLRQLLSATALRQVELMLRIQPHAL